MRDRLEPERSDLELLALSILLGAVVWLMVLGWSPDRSIGSHDQVASDLPFLEDFLHHAHGDWTRVSYRAELLGGAKIHDVMGTSPVYELLGWLGVGALDALNAVLFFTQLACAFFGARIATDLGRLVSGDSIARSWASRCGVVLLTAFSPALGWKLTTGHYEDVLGALFAISLVALLLAYRNRTISITLVAMTALVQLAALQTKGQQLIYGALFVGLLVVAAALPLRPARKLLVPVALTAGSIALSLPKLAGMIAHTESSDATRALGGASVIFSYLTATAHDWLASIPWGSELIASGRDESLWHEINFGFGPPLALVLLLPWSRQRLLAAGLVVSAVVPMLFAMDIAPLTWLVVHLCPPIQAFRVPERAVLAFALLLPAVGASALLVRPSPALPRPWMFPAMLASGGLLLLFAPAGLRETLAWGLALSLVLRPVFQWRLPERVPSSVMLIVLGIGSLAAFKERLRPYSTAESLIDNPTRLGDQLRSVQPELTSALSRIVVHFDLDGFQTNTAFAMGLSSLSGYLNPPRRFLALEAALAGTEANLLRNYFRLDESAPSFAVLQPLYNVRFGAFPEGKRLRMSPVGETAGPAWFSAALTRAGTVADVASALTAVRGTLATEAHRQAWVVTSDDAVRAAMLPDVVAPECAHASVTRVDAPIGGQTFRLQVDTPAACPLTMAMTFTTNLVARADGRRVTLFPTYGALTGVWVPAGAHEVVVEAVPVVPGWTRIAWLLGLALVGLALLETWRLIGLHEVARTDGAMP